MIDQTELTDDQPTPRLSQRARAMSLLRHAILEDIAHLIGIGAIEPVKINAEQLTKRIMAHVECASLPQGDAVTDEQPDEFPWCFRNEDEIIAHFGALYRAYALQHDEKLAPSAAQLKRRILKAVEGVRSAEMDSLAPIQPLPQPVDSVCVEEAVYARVMSFRTRGDVQVILRAIQDCGFFVASAKRESVERSRVNAVTEKQPAQSWEDTPDEWARNIEQAQPASKAEAAIALIRRWQAEDDASPEEVDDYTTPERMEVGASPFDWGRSEVVEVVRAAQALLTAVTFAPICELPNDAGEGYVARVPEQFVIDLEAAIASIRKAMAAV